MNEDSCDNIFVFQGFDAVTETVCAEWRVHIADVDQLRSILAPESDDDHGLNCQYDGLSKRDMGRIGKLCVPPIVPHAIFTGISRPSFAFDTIPYLIHTNFELPLMLEGRKPLAVFGDGYPSEWFDEFLAPFEPFVASGQLVRRIIDTPMPHLKQRRPDLDGMRDVFFALPEEEWRIDAYIKNIRNRTRDWDDDLERLQGSLLGYEEWQNDWWIQQRVKRRKAAEE
ncbi:MAG: hypothetical protein E5X74_23775 [Mesorhizobium sp.]|uniref:hypothetical protein n=1 Tax=Mesorhizobium sp. TaxID=1871066 RepID=UPI00120A2339|nr:hypothetical protein [Mesorhizobium sp.]TIO82699.1 MAG: hypothetical protein E5X74_23775 [Mesorhizobium sp.]